MDKRVFFILIVLSLSIGYFAGYFVGKKSALNNKRVERVVDNGSSGNASNPHSSGMMAENKSVDMERIHSEIKELKQRVEKNPGDFESLKSLGDIYYDIKDFKNAVSYYEMALKVKTSLPVMVDLSTCYVNLNKVDKAISILNEVLKEKPDFPQALYNMGIIYLHGKNDFKMAKNYWQKLYDIGAPGFDRDRLKMMLDALDKSIKEGAK